MKQRITIEQLKELTEEQKDRLRELWSPRLGDAYYHEYSDEAINTYYEGSKDLEDLIKRYDPLPLLSIGQMVDLLHDENKRVSIVASGREWEVIAHSEHAAINLELCDALWDIVKRVL